MFKKILPLFLLFSFPTVAQDVPRECDIEIEFGSYTQTIDAKIYAQIMERVTQTPEITEKHITTLGPQGERTLCLTLAENTDGIKIYEDLKNYIPPESKTGWERITLKNGPSFKTEQTTKFTPYNWEND